MKIEKTEFEVFPLFNYVFVEGKENPHIQKVTESGLFLPRGVNATEQEGSGSRLDAMEQIVRYGEVVEAGPECKELKKGDGVYFDVRSVMPIPFGKLGVIRLNEQNVLAYVRKTI